MRISLAEAPGPFVFHRDRRASLFFGSEQDALDAGKDRHRRILRSNVKKPARECFRSLDLTPAWLPKPDRRLRSQYHWNSQQIIFNQLNSIRFDLTRYEVSLRLSNTVICAVPDEIQNALVLSELRPMGV